MPTKPRSVTIDLTPKQQEKMRKATGEAHARIEVEVAPKSAGKKPLAAKAAPRGAIYKGPGKIDGMPGDPVSGIPEL